MDEPSRRSPVEFDFTAPRTSLLRQEPRDHCPPFSSTTPQVIKKNTYQRAFLAGPRWMSAILFSQTCREDLLDPKTPSCRHFGEKGTRHSTQRHRLTREAVEPSAAACVSVPECIRTMTSPAQIFLKATLRAAMFAQCADRRSRLVATVI